MQEVSAEQAEVAGHLTHTFDTQWAFWRWVCLRSAGFPAEGALKIAAPPGLIRASDDLLQAEKTMEDARTRALGEARASLDSLRQNNHWDDKERRVPLLRAVSKLKARQAPASNGMPDLPSIKDFCAAFPLVEAARLAFQQAFSEHVTHTSEVIREVACDPRFREAVTWQNRSAVHTAFVSLLKKSAGENGRSSRTKQHEELVASYLQRYCTKNDTIGFFGPLGWARFVPEGPALVSEPGVNLVTKRKVYFERWPIEVVAEVIARDRRVYPWLAPILLPVVRLEGTRLYHPMYGATPVTAQQAVLLRACTGISSAREIAKDSCRPGGHFQNEDQVYALLTELAKKHLVFWGFNIPMGAHPERGLRETLERIEDQEVRTKALGILEELESAAKALEAASGTAESVDLALEQIEQTFTRLTSISATRKPGETYGGRTLVYEDCRRDIEVRLGPDFMESLARPLSLLLMSQRWYSSQVVKIYDSKAQAAYDALVKAVGSSAVDAVQLWASLLPHMFGVNGEKPALALQLDRQFQEKWDRILHINSDAPMNTYSSDELREQVLKEFWAPSAGWNRNRYHCPDVMIAARDEEAVRQGDYQLILGELHGGNTLQTSLFVNQHPAPEELQRALAKDMEVPSLIPVFSRSGNKVPARVSPALFSPADFHLEFERDSLTTDRSRAIPVASIVVERKNGALKARTRDGRLWFDARDLLGTVLGGLMEHSFQAMASRNHNPRIVIDRLIVKRESWQFSAAEMSFARELEAHDRFLRTRSWARERRLPRFVFFKAPVERKPAYLDFESPILVNMFCKVVRRTQNANLVQPCIEITEMLPASDQLWLRDAKGKSYTSELRIVAVDLATAELR